MGIKRLWTHVKIHRNDAVTYVDLVELAKGYPGKMHILVDFYCWENYVREKFLHSLGEFSDSNHFMYAGGEYKLMDDIMKCLVQELRNVNIEPVFYLDGAKGSADTSTKQKLETWRSRFYESQANLKKIFLYLSGEIQPQSGLFRKLARPCLQEVQNVLTLQDMGCKLYLRVSGEADYIIAKHLAENVQAYCVFSNDTDFVIFPGNVYLAEELFDLNGEMGQQLSSFTPRVPKNLLCGIIRTESITKLLKLRDHKSLVELAIMAGNDFTSPYLDKYSKYRKMYLGQFALMSAMINSQGCVENCEFFGELMAHNENFRNAVLHSRQFYSLSLEDEEEFQTGYTFNLIADDIRQGKLPSTIVSMHRGIYWHRQIMEDPGPNMPVAEEVLSHLRAYIYKILLPHHKQFTLETGRTTHQLLSERKVYKVADNQIPSLVQVKQSSFSTNLNLFEAIIQHQEFGQSQSYFKLFGLRTGFVCLLLRYFLVLNWNQHLYLSPREFYVLVTWTLGKHDVTRYYKMKMLPSPRCLTLGSWFQALYRTAYAFLGNILELSHEFPSPKDLFSSSTWVALYTASFISHPSQDFHLNPERKAPDEEMLRTHQIILNTVWAYRPAVEKMTQGFFHFDLSILT